MSDSSRAIADAQDVLDDSITNAIHIHFDAGIATERERIINDLKDQFAFAMEAETNEGLDQAANSIQWSERWQLTFNDLIALIKGENK